MNRSDCRRAPGHVWRAAGAWSSRPFLLQKTLRSKQLVRLVESEGRQAGECVCEVVGCSDLERVGDCRVIPNTRAAISVSFDIDACLGIVGMGPGREISDKRAGRPSVPARPDPTISTATNPVRFERLWRYALGLPYKGTFAAKSFRWDGRPIHAPSCRRAE